MCCFSWETVGSDSFKELKNTKVLFSSVVQTPENLQIRYCMCWSFGFLSACVAALARNSPSTENQPCCSMCFNICHCPRTFERIHQPRASPGKSCWSWMQFMMSGKGAEREGWCSCKLSHQVHTKIAVFGKPSKQQRAVHFSGVWSPYWQNQLQVGFFSHFCGRVILAVQPCQDLGWLQYRSCYLGRL